MRIDSRTSAWACSSRWSRAAAWSQPARPAGGVALAALLSAAFVITAGFGGPAKDRPSTSTASAETCALESVTPSTVVVGLADVHPTYAVSFSGCTATWSLSWPTAGTSATEQSPAATIDAAELKDADAGRSNLYVTLRADDGTSNRTPVRVALKQRTTWGAFGAAPEPGRRGRTLTLRSVLGRADWDDGSYRGYAGAGVSVMFRASGASAFSTYSTVQAGKGGVLKVKVPARKSGAWRFEFAGSSTAAPAVSGADYVKVIPVARGYANCSALNDVYPHGVGLPGATDHVSGDTEPVTNFLRDRSTYDLNTKSDRDDDGIACEKL